MKITVISSIKPQTLTKHIYRDSNDKLIKTSSAHMTKGRAHISSIKNMEAFNSLLDGLYSNQAIAYGVPSLQDALIVSEKYLSTNEGAISRSDKFFSWPIGMGIMYLDYDPYDEVLDQHELIDTLLKLLPSANDCAWLWRPSASGNIYDKKTHELLIGLKGQHFYIAVKDASDIKRAGEVLFKRSWLAGYGRIVIAQNGAQLVRGIIDSAVWQPSRLDFAAGAVCGDGLERKPPLGLYNEGELLDTKNKILNLTEDEELKYLEMVEHAKGLTLQESAKQRDKHIDNMAKVQGVEPNVIKVKYKVAEEKQILTNDFQIQLAYEQGTITVADILSGPDNYHNALCLDPLEPDYNNRHPVAKIYNDSKGAFINSKAHGGRVFRLRNKSADALQQQRTNTVTFKELMGQIRETACDLSEVPNLVNTIQQGPFTDQERVLLTAEFERVLKDDKRLTREIKAILHPTKQKKPYVPYDVSNEIESGGQVSDQEWQQPGDHEEILSQNMPLDPKKWLSLHTTGQTRKPLGSVSNFRIMAEAYGIKISFNVISKDMSIFVPDHKLEGALHDESALDHVMSLANINRYPKSDVLGRVVSLAHENPINPVKEWVLSVPCDGIDHIGQLIGEIIFADEENKKTSQMLIRRWFLAAVAAGTGHTQGCEYVLVWVDEMGGAGKTRFFRTLCANNLRADGVTLDLTDKDSIKDAISNWLVELGELDGTFKKSDIAHLKSFMSKQRDDLRLPYARTYSKFSRTTAFMASVNQINFLIDDTGNRRFWPIRVKSMNHLHTVDIQQVWAQAYAAVLNGETWHLTEAENILCANRNQEFKSVSRIVDTLSSRINLEGAVSLHLNATELLAKCNVHHPHRGELNETARWLRVNGVKQSIRKGKRGFNLAPLHSETEDNKMAPYLVK